MLKRVKLTDFHATEARQSEAAAPAMPLVTTKQYILDRIQYLGRQKRQVRLVHFTQTSL